MTLDYKKIITNKSTRMKILDAFSFVPDKQMIEIQYKIKTGRKLNLCNPKRYTEKLQWYKLYYRDPIMKKCVDKYEVRRFVSDRGLSNILNINYGVYNTPSDIEWDSLPNSFVLKDTLGSGGNSVILIKDKEKMNKEYIMSELSKWISVPINRKSPGREWVYEGQQHRIIIEKYLDTEYGDLPDYKFFCFNGEPELIYMMTDYRDHHDKGKLAFLDKHFKLLNVRRSDFDAVTKQPKIPDNFEEMIRIAIKLSSGFPHVRVDLFNIDGEIIFGELTFFNASGYFEFVPDEFDYKLGSKFVLPELRGGV